MEITEKPNYVLKANEGILYPKNPKLVPLKKAVWIIIALIIIGSLIFRENLFAELSLSAQILLITLVLVVIVAGGEERVPSPFEIWFFDDYFVIYREKRYYDRKVTRKEYNKYYYKDISKVEYRKLTNRIQFEGIIESVWYNYNKDGTLPEKPTYHRTTDGGICYFYTTASPEIDFVAEIEKHSPLKVQIVQ